MILKKLAVTFFLALPILIVVGVALHSSSQAQDIRPAIEDLTPPELVDVAISPNLIDTDFMDVTITVTVRVTDDLSGVKSVEVGLATIRDMPVQDHRQIYQRGASVDPSQNEAVVEVPITLLQYSKEGEWGVAFVYARDRIGNYVYYFHPSWAGSWDSEGNVLEAYCDMFDYICLPQDFDKRFINYPDTPVSTPTPTQTIEPTPTAPATVMPVCTPPPCPPEGNLVCLEPNGCPGGCGVSCRFNVRLPTIWR